MISPIRNALSHQHHPVRHLTSPHLTSPHLTSPHPTSPHPTSPHLISSLLTSRRHVGRPPRYANVKDSCTRACGTTPHYPPLAGPHPSRVTPSMLRVTPSARGLPSPPPPPKVRSTKKYAALGPVPPIQLHTVRQLRRLVVPYARETITATGCILRLCGIQISSNKSVSPGTGQTTC